jgi:plastocyanin
MTTPIAATLGESVNRMGAAPGGVSNPPTEAQASRCMRDLAHPAEGGAAAAREIMQAASDITNGTIAGIQQAEAQRDVDPTSTAATVSVVGSSRTMTTNQRYLRLAMTALTIVSNAGCGGADAPSMPGGPTPTVTANAFILPGAVSLGDSAFGDEPVVVHQGERLRWINADTLAHVIVAESPDATDFRRTDELPPGGEQSFVMTRPGTTRIHCETHLNMTGTLIVREN